MAKKHVVVYFKMGVEQAEVMLDMCAHVLATWVATDELEEALIEFTKCMYFLLRDAILKNERWCKMDFNSCEALLYYKLWNRVDTSKWPYGTVIVGDHIKKIDKLKHHGKTLSYAKK